MLRLFFSLSVFISVFCSSPPEVSRGGPESSIIATSVDYHADSPFAFSPNLVYFSRIDNGELLTGKLFESSYKRSNRFYFLNAPAGQYAVIGFLYHTALSDIDDDLYDFPTSGKFMIQSYTPPLDYIVLLGHDAVRQTIVSVTPGSFQDTGRIQWQRRELVKLSEADDVQIYYAGIIVPGKLTLSEKPPFGKVYRGMGDKIVLMGDLKNIQKDNESRIHFLKKATKDFQKTEWLDIIK
jgi:hypothetical protein